MKPHPRSLFFRHGRIFWLTRKLIHIRSQVCFGQGFRWPTCRLWIDLQLPAPRRVPAEPADAYEKSDGMTGALRRESRAMGRQSRLGGGLGE